ncbi:MAG TPA: hypothetical protein VL856_14060, partial [Acidimicrobiia bacterium]|nr:hypothetical protein [Acidimicrobiia bacterium]
MANLDEFTRDRAATWQELDGLVAAAGNSPAKLGPTGVRRLGACYRATAADLALARRRFPSDPVVLQLEQRVRRGRQAVYHTTPKTKTFRDFVTRDYWRRIRERPALLVCAIALLAVPTLLAGYWAWRDPGRASGLVPTQFQSVTEPREPGQ